MFGLSHETQTILGILALLAAGFCSLIAATRAVTPDNLSAAKLLATLVGGVVISAWIHVRRLTGSQLPDKRRVLSRREAQATYDKLGSNIHDSESAYGGPAIQSLLRAAGLKKAEAIFEFGCGPGRLARKIFDEELPLSARYVAVDASPVMVALARRRMAAEIERGSCEVLLTDGDPLYYQTISSFIGPTGMKKNARSVGAQSAGRFDVVVSTYVLDLLSEEDALAVVAEAWRLLRPGGRLCLSGITYGTGLGSSIVGGLWELVHWVNPATVGGCRHQRLVPYLEAASAQGCPWRIAHTERIPGFGKSLLSFLWSEVVVAIKDSK